MPQAVARVLVHEAPVGAHQPALVGLAHGVAGSPRRPSRTVADAAGVGAIWPDSTRSSVVLPEPDSPTMATTSPAIDVEGDIEAAEDGAVEQGQAVDAEQRSGRSFEPASR